MPELSMKDTPLTAQQLQAIKLREANEAFGDIEARFNIANDVGPVGYGMDMDFDNTQFIAEPGVPGYAEGGSQVLGSYNPHDEPLRETIRSKDKKFNVTLPPDGIAIWGPDGANPRTWGHEFMHREFGTNEDMQRTVEAYDAKNKDEWDDRVKRYAGLKGIDFEDAERRLVSGITAYGSNRDSIPDWEYEQGARLAPDQLSFIHKLLAPKYREAKDNYSEQRNKQSYIARELRK